MKLQPVDIFAITEGLIFKPRTSGQMDRTLWQIKGMEMRLGEIEGFS